MRADSASIAAGVLLALSAPGPGAQASPGAVPVLSAAADASAVTAQRFTLANGLTVIVQPDRRAPSAVLMLWLRVGSMDETDAEAGVAHVLEHMMFKGTPTLAEGEYSRRIAALGGRDNAFTSRDVTAYHVQLPASQLRAAMALEAERFAHNAWSVEALARELDVIREERRQRIEDVPGAQLFEQFQATAWQVHPYRRPVIGWMSSLQGMQAQTVRDFRRRWYVPANAALVVVGDVDVQQVRQWAEALFGGIAARVVPARTPLVEPPQRGMRRVELRGRVPQPSLLMGWQAPRLAEPDADSPEARDALALLLLAGVLDGHAAARLGRALVQGQGGERLADAVSASYGLAGRGPQQFVLSATVRPGVAVERVEAALRAQIDRIAREGVIEAELRRVRNQWAASEVFQRDSLFAQARELGMHWALDWPLDANERLLQRLATITPADVQRVAARYFGDETLTVAVMRPQEEAR